MTHFVTVSVSLVHFVDECVLVIQLSSSFGMNSKAFNKIYCVWELDFSSVIHTLVFVNCNRKALGSSHVSSLFNNKLMCHLTQTIYYLDVIRD